MGAHFAFNYPGDSHILIHFTRTEAGIALFADMHGFQLLAWLNFLIVHLALPH
jgi:hypothetical protein